jgi:DNA-binding transcriptional LysR family regulator
MSKISDLRTFVRVVERGSFASASHDLGITPSAVSKLVTRLEDRLGVRLLHRTTRRVALTPEGETYHVRARDILAAIDDAEAEVSQAGRQPRGRLRVNCVPAFALHQLMPALPDFVACYPAVHLDFAITDRVVDILAENADVGIRTGSISDPSLVSRKIADVRRGLFASPAYLAQRGKPRTPDQLREHECIVLNLSSLTNRWPFHDGGRLKVIDIVSRVLVDNSEAALRLAIAGGGIARLADLVVADAVREGRLEPVLTESHVAEPAPLAAVYPQGRHRMPKVRAFLDFLVDRFSHAPWREPRPLNPWVNKSVSTDIPRLP